MDSKTCGLMLDDMLDPDELEALRRHNAMVALMDEDDHAYDAWCVFRLYTRSLWWDADEFPL